MIDEFPFDVFLSHSSKDKAVVRTIAERLRADGLRVWFDDWELRPGDSIPAKIEQGLERSRILVLCMSANAFGSDWATLESQTFRFRDPLNLERRFIPLRLDDAPIRGSLAQFLYVDWYLPESEPAYAKLLEACQLPAESVLTEPEASREKYAEQSLSLELGGADAIAYAFTRDGRYAFAASGDTNIRWLDLNTGRCIRVFEGHSDQVWAVALSRDERYLLSGGDDGKVLLWDIGSGRCVSSFRGHTSWVKSVAWSPDGRLVISAGFDASMRIWEVQGGNPPRIMKVTSQGSLWSVIWGARTHEVICGGHDGTVRVWDMAEGQCQHVLEGHTEWVGCLALSPDKRHLLSGSRDDTVRLWDIETGLCLRVLRGHRSAPLTLAWSDDGLLALSGGADHEARLWQLETGRCLRVLRGHGGEVRTVAWTRDGLWALSGDFAGVIRFWDLSEFVAASKGGERRVLRISASPEQVQYTNAKVLLVGDSGAGKTGLSKRLTQNDWEPSDSTVGAWATQWKLPVSSDDGVEREIWLWDFGGQADQRLIHQLYMEDTALAVLVFDGQKEDLFETLGQWDRDLTRASTKPFAKVLAAGRVDAGGLRMSRAQLETFAKERGFIGFLETSAKANIGCGELKQAILGGIRWADIPWRSSPALFKRLKEEIIRMKDEDRVLMRFNELRDALRLRMTGEEAFKDEELKAVIGLLAGPGVVWELAFGSWILLQPERINAYAQAVIQTLRADEYERGALAEERVLKGDLAYQSSAQRLAGDEERFVLLAMHQTLVERGLCLREHTDSGPLLIFPSYYRRERPELVGHPAVLVSYRFNGFLDDIYATLVVRLHHTKPFQGDELWRYAADFKTLTGKQLGVKLSRRAEGAGELEVYFDPAIKLEEKIIFSRYVHEHVLQKGRDVVRLRHYVCPHCGTPDGNREVAMKRLDEWLGQKSANPASGRRIKSLLGMSDGPTIICAACEKRVPLWDEMEECFASPEIQERVRELQEQSSLVLDNESKERALVGEVISTVALAGQISREFNVSDHGIDMEIEFKNDAGDATGKKLYLQLKSGDSYLRKQRRDGVEIFEIKKERHVRYWMEQAFPVMLVIRTSDREVRWMEVREWLRREGGSTEKAVKRIVFAGDRFFDVMGVRRWRDRVLGQDKAQTAETTGGA